MVIKLSKFPSKETNEVKEKQQTKEEKSMEEKI